MKDIKKEIFNELEVLGEGNYWDWSVNEDTLLNFVDRAIDRVREGERERVSKIVEKWMKTSNPAYAQDLFDALTPKD